MSGDLTDGLDPLDVAQRLVELDMDRAEEVDDALRGVGLPGVIELRFLALSFQQAKRIGLGWTVPVVCG